MADTLVATPDPQWWNKVFTPEEYSQLVKLTNEILDEQTEDDTLELTIRLPETEVVPTLKALGDSYQEGNPIIDKLIEALAFEYHSNPTIPADRDCSRLYERINEEPEDEDDWFV